MKKLIAIFLILAGLSFSSAQAQIVYTYPTTTLTTVASSGSVYLTYPSKLKLNYVGYTTINADTMASGETLVLVHQTQVSIDNVTWFDYGSSDTMINTDAAEKDEDYIYSTTPFNYIREKFTVNDSATVVITGYSTFKKQN